MPPNRGASTASVACVSPSSTGARSSSTSECSLVNWNETCFSGTTSRTSSDPPSCGRRRKLGRFVPSRCQSAPGARARRTLGAASTRPGHHSGQRAGSASTAQTSSTGAGSVRLASYRGKELLSAEHPLELGLPLVVAELLDSRVRRVARRLLDPEVAIGERGDLGKVRDRHDLSMLGEPPEQSADRVRRLAADPGVDLVEDERVAAGHGRDGERDPRELASRGCLRDRRERQSRVRADEEDGLVASGRARLVALAQLADELALAHADAAQLGGDGVGERRRCGVPLGPQLEGERVDTFLGGGELARRDLGGIGAVLERRELRLRLLAPREQLVVRRAAEAALRLGDPVEPGLELLEPARLRFERGQEGVEIGRGLAQPELDVAQLVAGALQLRREPLERRDRAFRERDEVGALRRRRPA